MAGLLGAPGADEHQRPARGPELAPEAVAALDRLVVRVERARYARPRGDGPADDRDAVRADVETCTESLTTGVAPRTRHRASWWPRSVLRRDRVVASEVAQVEVAQVEVAQVEVATSGTVTDHVG